jgi:hypothetical protein
LYTYTISIKWSFSIKFPHHYTVCTSLHATRPANLILCSTGTLTIRGWEVWRGYRLGSLVFKPHCQPQDPPNLLYNLYNVSFPGVNQPGMRLEHPPWSSTEAECGYSSPLPLLKACMACNRTALPLTICCGQYRSSSSSLYSFLQPPCYLSLSDTCIFLSTLLLDTLSLRSAHNVGAKVSHSYRQHDSFVCFKMKIFRLLMECHSTVHWTAHHTETNTKLTS